MCGLKVLGKLSKVSIQAKSSAKHVGDFYYQQRVPIQS